VIKEPATLVELLRSRAERHPDRTAFTFLLDGEQEGDSLTYAELERDARRVAALLQQSGLGGERALLLYPPGLAFISAYFGCLYAGVVAVPVFPPRMNRNLDRLHSIIADAGARAVLATDDVIAGLRQHMETTPALAALRCFSTESLTGGPAWTDPGILPDDAAFLQYTSGSTSTPKGVQVTHGNLLANERMMREAFGHSEGLVVAGWLPVYHDMGLIGNVIHPLYMGGTCILMSPAAFLQKPLRWLNAVSRYGAETSGGPNFAFDLCADRVAEEEKAGLDLSAWKVAFCGAEPVRAATLERFAAAFAGCGFRREAFYPCYGLAESTLFVTGGERSAEPVVRAFSAGALEQERAEAAGEGEGSTRLVGCGVPAAGSRVEIVRARDHARCAPGEVGEIWVSGPHVSRGYWNRLEENEVTFGARLSGTGEGPFLRTGDLGFMERGELFVTGRIKDLIILRGRNLYPQDIEATAGAAHPALQPGGGAAFGVDVDGEERLVIVHEVRRTALRELGAEEVSRRVREEVAATHEAQVHAVALIRPSTLPKTSSGKVQRRACRALFLSGGLEPVASSVLTGAPEAAPTAGAEPADGDALSVAAALEAHLRAEAARVLRLPLAAVQTDRPLTALGLDSLSAAQLAARLEEALGAPVEPALLLEPVPPGELARSLALRLQETQGEPLPELDASAATAGEHPLSSGQRALWFLYRLAPESAAYNVAVALDVRGALDAALLQEALDGVVDRHAALRTVLDDEEPVQRVLERVQVPLVRWDAAAWSEEELRGRLAEEAHRPFRLSEAPLVRAHLARRGEDRHVLLLAAHHAVLDFRSLEIVMDELLWACGAQRAGAPSPLEGAGVQHTDFVRWQQALLAAPAGERLRAETAERLRGAPTVLALPTDAPRPPVQEHRGGAHPFRLPPELSERLRELARDEGATVYTLLLAAFQLLLHRYTGQRDLLVGSPAAGRVRPAMAEVVGYLVNPVVLRARFEMGATFRQLLQRTQEDALAALRAQAYPFEQVVEQLQPERDVSRSPVFQVMFVLQQASRLPTATACALGHEGVREVRGALVLEPLALETRSAQFDLTLAMGEVEGSLAGSFTYDAALFEPATVARVAGHFQALLKAAAAAPGASAATLPLLGRAERGQLLDGFNRTEVRYGRGEALLHRLFEEQAARTPEAVALVFEDEEVTYRELDERAGGLARLLRGRGVGPEVRVGICAERSPELVVALLGVLRAGGAYVPLDPEYPAERLAHMVADSGVRVLLAGGSVSAEVAGAAEVVRLDGTRGMDGPAAAAVPEWEGDPGQLAYVIYTSGSTGTPKGAMNSHRGIVNRLLWMQAEYGLDGSDTVLQKTPFSFDVSVWEFFWPLLTGARLVLARPGGHRDPAYLSGLIRGAGVTTLHFVPSMLSAFLEAGGTGGPALRRVMCSGEALPPDLAGRFFERLPGVELHNLYGPTEAAVDVTCWACAPGRDARTVPIGRPVANTRTYVLDPELNPAPTGVAGELFLGGVQVGRGYLGRAELTAERFVPDPYAARGGRMYRTGDLARWRADGVLEYLGRTDFQVKIRGFRIELGEIESVLVQHPGVAECVVLAAEAAPGEARLTAYVVPRGPAPVPAGLRDHLRARLPEHMVPAAWVTLDAMPLTPSGKLDRRALPRLEASRDGLGERYVAPRSPIEETLAAIWSEVLGVERVGVHDSFFDLGGYSLLAVRVGTRVQREFGVSLPLHTLFQAPTIEALSVRIAQSQLEARSDDEILRLLQEMEELDPDTAPAGA
jgi:amino acid adenylation domain-containing protein